MTKFFAFFMIMFIFASGFITAANAGNCKAVMPRYSQFQSPGLLSGLDRGCLSTLNQKEQLFVAGMTHSFLKHCEISTHDRLKLMNFLSSSTIAAVIGSQYGNPNLSQGLGDQAASITSYAAGGAVAENIGCTIGAGLVKGVIAYLDKTAKGDGNGAIFVKGCVEYYSGRYSEQQCKCIADIGRSIFPNIHSSRFSPSSIRQIIKSNPFVGLQIGIQCRVGNY